MLQFFKFSGPVQLGGLLLLIFIFKIPVLFLDFPILLDELHIKILTEKLLNSQLIYQEIIDGTPPLSALFYTFIGFIFNYQIITFKIVSLFLLFFQSILFKNILNENEILSEKGDIPALIFIILHCLLLDFYILSNAFLANTFLIIALGRVFKHLKSEYTENEIFYTGLNLGIAFLFNEFTILFFFFTIITFIIFTRTNFRFYLIKVLGFVFPIFSVYTFYFLFDSQKYFLEYFLFNYQNLSTQVFDFQSFLIYFSYTFFLVLMGVFLSFTYKRYINYQIVCFQNMLLWMIFTIIVVFFIYSKTTSDYIVLLPFFAFFISQFFILLPQKKLKNTVFALFFILTLFGYYGFIFESNYKPFNHDFSGQFVSGNKWNVISENKKIAYFGDDYNVFLDNTSTTPFLEPKLSKKYLEDINTYEKVIFISNSFENNPPDLIIDDWNIMNSIFLKIPNLKIKYAKSKHFNLYERVSNK